MTNPAPPVSLTPGRCGWCNRFVKAETAPTVWWVQVSDHYRQVAGNAWNVFARTLCPSCAENNDIATSWRRPGELSDALERQTAMSHHSREPSPE